MQRKRKRYSVTLPDETIVKLQILGERLSNDLNRSQTIETIVNFTYQSNQNELTKSVDEKTNILRVRGFTELHIQALKIAASLISKK